MGEGRWDPDDKIACGGLFPQPCAYCGKRIAYFTDLSSADRYTKGWMHVSEDSRSVNCYREFWKEPRAEPEFEQVAI